MVAGRCSNIMPKIKLGVRNNKLTDIINPDVELEQIVTGFKFTEGPIWHPVENHLRFSDIMGNSIYQWSETDGLKDILPNSHLANGNTYDHQGRMLTCHHGTSRITRTEHDGSITVIASHYKSKQLNSPNDVIVKSDGTIYFTDPMSGRSELFGIPRESELGYTGVFRVNPDGSKLTLLANDFNLPNGLCFSPNEKQLFVNDTRRFHIKVFDMKKDGTLENERIWAETTGEGKGGPDGMKFDSAGTLCCTGPGGIYVFAPNATCLGVIRIPEQAANFTWGDDDLKSLYITATTSIYRVRVNIPGNKLF